MRPLSLRQRNNSSYFQVILRKWKHNYECNTLFPPYSASISLNLTHWTFTLKNKGREHGKLWWISDIIMLMYHNARNNKFFHFSPVRKSDVSCSMWTVQGVNRSGVRALVFVCLKWKEKHVLTILNSGEESTSGDWQLKHNQTTHLPIYFQYHQRVH